MKHILSPPPRRLTPAWCMIQQSVRRFSVGCGVAGLALLAIGVGSKILVPFCIWGLLALGAAMVVRRTCERRLELWLHGTEMLAEARISKTWTLTWVVDGRSYSSQTSQTPLLWTNGLVRILIDLDQPSRMVPVSLEMLEAPEMEAPSPVLPTVLAPRPRRSSLLVLQAARQQRTAALATALLSLVVACVVSPFVLERRRFLAEAVKAGTGQVVGRTQSTVVYEFDGRRSFESGGKEQRRWPVGKTLAVYRHHGFVVAEPEVPGMRLPLGLILVCLPIVAATGILMAAVGEARLAQKLWRFGKEVPAEIISDHVQNQRREVICRFASGGFSGVTRREFAASRKPLEGFRGEPVVLVDPRDPKSSRMLLADEA